jgi:hypothetical protein
MAFRAWNYGLAATEAPGGLANNQYVVWEFNGERWHPNPTFPGQNVCPGRTIVWAGKLDYWLVGEPPRASHEWRNICRFDGEDLEWESLAIPQATLAHVTPPSSPREPHPPPRHGGITSATCFAWDNCWFFGAFGAVVHWDGQALTDASPDPSQRPLRGEYLGAAARQGSAGDLFGAAVTTTAERHAVETPLELLPAQPDGAPPPEMFGSRGGGFSPLPLSVPTVPQMDPQLSEPPWPDPFRTDLVAVDLAPSGAGWVAGNPAGLNLGECQIATCLPGPGKRGFASGGAPRPSPLLPVSVSGASPACTPPAEGRFTYTPVASQVGPEGAFLWSSISIIPSTGEALAGGLMRPLSGEGLGPDEDGQAEPDIVRARCDGTTSVTRFRIEDPTVGDYLAPADREGRVTAIAANAANDAWAATSEGSLANGRAEPPHLYRLTSGLPPEAPAGDDLEPSRHPAEEPPLVVIEPPPPESAPPAPSVLTKTERVQLKPAVYSVRSKLHRVGHSFSLYLSFKLRRPVTLGAQALRNGRIVSEARPRLFAGHSGLLILKLDRKHWPTKVRFVA